MRRNFTRMVVLVCAVLCASAGVQAQSVGHRKAAESLNAMLTKVPQHRAMHRNATEEVDIVLLDSVISDTHRAYYEYNEYGWLVSEKHYAWNDTGDENSGIMFDTEESYFLEYDLDEQGRCTRYAQFQYNADETKGREVERVIVTWTGDREHTEQYFSLSEWEEGWDGLELVEELSYDRYGNLCLYKEYEWDSESGAMVLDEFMEMKFTANVMEYYYDENGIFRGFDFIDDVDLYCCYNVDYERGYDLEGFKVDEVVEGLTTTKTYYEIDKYLGEDEVIDLDNLDPYWELDEEEIVTLNPSRNRYASIYSYSYTVSYDESYDNVDMIQSTRSGSDKEFNWSYTFEYDKYDRLVKWVSTDSYGYVETYTCSYVNDEYNEITLEEFEKSWVNRYGDDDEGACLRGSFYGEVDEENTSYGGDEAPATRRSDELQEGYNELHFEEGGWIYEGYKHAEWVWDEDSETEVLQVTSGDMHIHRNGGTDGGYRANDPADNYEFPIGMFFMGVESESVGISLMYRLDLAWDMEIGGWRIMHGQDNCIITSHYTNAQGQIVDEIKTYVFDAKSERMVVLPDVDLTIYSFDAQNRLSTIEYSAYTVHYVYLNDDCDYLAESYSIDNASGDKYDVCKYYYSTGKYTPPYTDIEEVKTAEKAWNVNGTSVIADGDIVLYTVNGQVVARGNGVVVAPQYGLYIVEINGTRAKIVIK